METSFEYPKPPAILRCLSTRGQIALTTCVCGAANAFLYAVDPSRYAVYPQCLLYNATGIYCAGCGATRALYALLHGRVLVAMRDNALFTLLLPVVLYVAGIHVLAAWRANAWPNVPLNRNRLIWQSAALFLAMVTFMILRNLHGWPYEWLRPA